jgi:hypothetical protein
MIANVVPWADGKSFTKCAENRDRVIDYLAELKPDLLILADWAALDISVEGRPARNRDQIWKEGLEDSLLKLSEISKNVVYFGIVPAGKSLLDCVDRRDALTESCFNNLTSMKSIRTVQEKAIKDAKLTFINPVDWMCTKTCPPIIAGTPVFSDGSHIASEFAKKLSPLFRAYLKSNTLL